MNATQQKFKPIIFSTEMVQAILAGRKTQTRRVFNNQPKADESKYQMQLIDDYYFGMCVKEGVDDFPYHGFFKPKYQPGDILWVQETSFEITGNLRKYPLFQTDEKFMYKADLAEIGCHPWKPSIFMPKEAARIFLKVTSVRVERLQDISENDAIGEGIDFFNHGYGGSPAGIWYRNYKYGTNNCSPKYSFQTLWDSINAKKHPWESNPWVWVYEFERIEKPENFN